MRECRRTRVRFPAAPPSTSWSDVHEVGLAGSPIRWRARAGDGAWPVSSHRHEPRHGKPETTGDKLRPQACGVTTSARSPLARTADGRGADLEQRKLRPVNRPGGRSISLCPLWFHSRQLALDKIAAILCPAGHLARLSNRAAAARVRPSGMLDARIAFGGFK